MKWSSCVVLLALILSGCGGATAQPEEPAKPAEAMKPAQPAAPMTPAKPMTPAEPATAAQPSQPMTPAASGPQIGQGRGAGGPGRRPHPPSR